MHRHRKGQAIAAMVAVIAALMVWVVVNRSLPDGGGRRDGPTTTRPSDTAAADEGGEVDAAPADDAAVGSFDAGGAVPDTAPPVSTGSTGPGRRSTRPSTGQGAERSGTWVRVGQLAGTADDRSGAFSLSAVDTRLVYSSEAASFSVYVVDEAQGRDATAGFADLECDRPCSGEMIVVPPAGRFHLEVDTAGGRFEVTIEEYRAAP